MGGDSLCEWAWMTYRVHDGTKCRMSNNVCHIISGNMCCYTLRYLLMQNNRPVVNVKKIRLKEYDAKIYHDFTPGLPEAIAQFRGLGFRLGPDEETADCP